MTGQAGKPSLCLPAIPNGPSLSKYADKLSPQFWESPVRQHSPRGLAPPPLWGGNETNSVERCLRALRHEPADHKRVTPLIISPAAQLAGVPFLDCNRDPNFIVDCQMAAWQKCGYDGIYSATINWTLAEALGVPVQFCPDLSPAGFACPLTGPKELSALRPVPEAKGALRMGLLPETTSYVWNLLGDSVLSMRISSRDSCRWPARFETLTSS